MEHWAPFQPAPAPPSHPCAPFHPPLCQGCRGLENPVRASASAASAVRPPSWAPAAVPYARTQPPRNVREPLINFLPG